MQCDLVQISQILYVYCFISVLLYVCVEFVCAYVYMYDTYVHLCYIIHMNAHVHVCACVCVCVCVFVHMSVPVEHIKDCNLIYLILMTNDMHDQ